MVSERVAQLLRRMTVEEKLGQINIPIPDGQDHDDPAHVPPMGLDQEQRFVLGQYHADLGPGGGFFQLATTAGASAFDQAERYNELQDLAAQTRLAIPLLQIVEGTHGVNAPGATVFPEGPALGSSWNMELIQGVYHAVASEARSTGVHLLCTLVIEPTRDPRLGRSCEGYTEDPYLASRIARAILDGAQGDDLSRGDTAGVVMCHFPGQSQPESGLERGAMRVSERDLRTVFLPPWEEVLGQDGAVSVMATYAAIDGKPTHGSRALLTGLLRDELGFEGIVLSEGMGFQTLEYEGVAADQQEAGRQALHAGVDVNITYEQAYLGPMRELLGQEVVDETLLDIAVGRVLSVKERLGLFDAAQVNPAQAAAIVGSEPHRNLALQAARESIVVLRNRDRTLPLRQDLARIAVIGPNAANTLNQLGDYTIVWQGADVEIPAVSVLDGIRSVVTDGTDVAYSAGCSVIGESTDGFADAVAVAASADVAIVVVGEQVGNARADGSERTVGEGADVANLNLSGVQEQLVQAVHATGTPVVVVLINGRPLSIPWIDDHAAAVVEAWFPGEAGGTAIAEILFGATEPSGRLPLTIPRHVGQLPVYYDHETAKDFTSQIALRYADMPHTPLYEFGAGLSYTTFEYTDLELDVDRREATRVTVRFTIANTGDRSGWEVPQVYVRDLIASSTPAGRQLRSFEKVFLQPGQSVTCAASLDYRAFTMLQDDWTWTVEPGDFDIMVGASSRDIKLSARVTATLVAADIVFTAVPTPPNSLSQVRRRTDDT